MRLKSFHAKTVGDAMRQVRMALGDDAIIVATREEEGGGVRVTAAIEDNAPVRKPARCAPAPPPVEDDSPDDVVDLIADALHRHGTPAAISERLTDALVGLDLTDPVLALGAALDAVFAFKPIADGRQNRPLMLVGPPGAGKTLTTAKLAARAVFRNRPAGVITTDTVRAGGVDQLKAFARLLKVKLVAVEDPAALGDALTVLRNAEQVIIDTAGRNPFDAADMQEMRQLIAAGEVEPILVLPAGMDALEAGEIGTIFRTAGVRRLIVTRLDLTRRLGSLLAAVYESRLIFSDVSITAKVADGLSNLNPVALARLLMPGREQAAKPARQTGTHA
ncbi:MAG: GTPase [Azospirillum sp.]|nr:GTPase [Azospirillum sp.]